MTRVVIVPTGTANTASVTAALQRLGADVTKATGAEDVSSAPGVVLPGVGAFAAAMAAVDGLGLRETLHDRIEQGRPTLVVCVGMQLLCARSEESPGAAGLEVVPETVSRFGPRLRVPQLGWNRVESEPDSRFIEPGWAYFANSYRIERPVPGWRSATTDYGGSFVSAMERGDVLACQFHPELSGRWGASLLARWLATTREAA